MPAASPRVDGDAASAPGSERFVLPLDFVRALSDRESFWLSTDLVGDTCWKPPHPLSVAVLAAKTFTGVDDEPVSVFQCDDHVAEAAVAAAQNLTRSLGERKPIYLLRLPSWVVSAFGIGLDDVPDDDEDGTGIKPIDLAHRNLRAPAARFVDLTRWLLEQRCRGLDLVRVVQPPSLARHYARFAELPSGQITPKALKRAKQYAANYVLWNTPRPEP